MQGTRHADCRGQSPVRTLLQHSKAYFQTLKNSQNLSFMFYSTISCIERKKGRLQLVFLFHGIVWRDSAVEESEA